MQRRMRTRHATCEGWAAIACWAAAAAAAAADGGRAGGRSGRHKAACPPASPYRLRSLHSSSLHPLQREHLLSPALHLLSPAPALPTYSLHFRRVGILVRVCVVLAALDDGKYTSAM